MRSVRSVRRVCGPYGSAIAREMYELGFNFNTYITHHSLNRSEGLVLRYLTAGGGRIRVPTFGPAQPKLPLQRSCVWHL